jgi:hypothetical protein
MSVTNVFGISLVILGQSQPAAATTTLLYDPPHPAMLYRFNVCNLVSTVDLFRLAIVPNPQVLANKHYLFFDFAVQPGDTYEEDFGGLDVGVHDKVWVYATSGNLAFNLWGKQFGP